MSNNEGSKDGRARAWTFLVYPFESAPDNWRDILDNECVPWIESPLHDPDPDAINIDEHDYRHHHVELLYDGKKSYDQVSEITKKLNATRPFVVNDIRAMTRYFAHLDQPNKQHFSAKDIIPHCGADLKDYLTNKSDKYFYIKQMKQYCLDNKIMEFAVLFDLAAEFHYDDWFPLLCDNCSFVMNLFLKSYRNTDEETKLYLEDPEKIIDGQSTELPS